MPQWILWVGGLLVALLVIITLRRYLRRTARRALLRFRARVDRYKLTRKQDVIANLLADSTIAAAVRRHSEEQGCDEDDAWSRVRVYLNEMVPFFNVLAYYRFGYGISRFVLNLFYKVSVDHAGEAARRGLPRESIGVYLMNHRSNADYVLVSYALAGKVLLSYAVGEWARAFPLEYLFKSFGSYFIRRGFREPLYHTVLERYVQLITRNGVTQGIFPEGGLTRDGKLRPSKIGLLDYMLGVARDPVLRARLYVVPVAINYDRVLEDRSLLRELAEPNAPRRSRLAQLGDVLRFLWWNGARLVMRRWKRYGRAAVTIGAPIPVAPWIDELEARGVPLFALPRSERLGHVQLLCDMALGRIGELIPVTPVPLACAAIQSFDGDFVARDALLDRMEDMRDVLKEFNAQVIRADRDIAETFDRAFRMLRMRHVIEEHGGGFAVLPRGRPLVSYYANSIVHLLGPFAEGIRERDALPLSGLGRDP